VESFQYPIGKYSPQPFSQQQLTGWLLDIRFLPQHLEHAILNLDEAQLATPYRPEGWTVHHLIHHVADSHMNAYIRFKLGLTEEVPVIKTYDEAAWANLADTDNLPVNVSLTLLHALHMRWMEVLKSITEAQWERTVFHPGLNTSVTLWHLLGMYAWHGRHHTAHVTVLREQMKW